MEQLKKCPFCGGEAKICDTGIEPSYYWIYCKECGCKQPSSIHRKSVINAWNTRTPVKRVIGRLIDEGVPFPLEDKDVGFAEGLSCAIEIVKEEM